MVQINLEKTLFKSKDHDPHVWVAKDIEEASKVVENGFEHVTGENSNGGKIIRKRK